ncbi:MAG: manganese efflux pump [Parvularcula sp.]|jgi:putative Mn2+ efflux pump MntP|nr:manganese efflux pump [Parvularcula sp.]
MPNIAALAATCLSLSTDAFAASVARGTVTPARQLAGTLRLGAVFGLAEGLMCLFGYLAASTLGEVVAAVDHWAALMLLAIIGGRMIKEGFEGGGEDERTADEKRSLLGTVVTALGTSIDAAAVGAALAFAGAPIIIALFVGLTSFIASSIGFALGPMIGSRFGKTAEVAGGAVLILIGGGIFIQHMFG